MRIPDPEAWALFLVAVAVLGCGFFYAISMMEVR